MAGISALEAHDLVRFAETFEERLIAAHDAHSRRRGLEREKRWLTEALQVVAEAREGAAALLKKARELPELAEVREEFAGDLQQAWVDTLERLHAGITFHAGSRSPLIETLFPHLKFPNLRKASRPAIEQYNADLERRAALAYVARMLSQESFSFAPPVLEQVRQAYSRWQSCFGGMAMGEGDPEVREALLTLGKQVDLAIRQARMLAEAALTPVRGAYEESNLSAKPRRRTPKPLVQEEVSAAGTSDEPPVEASALPTPPESAEVKSSAATETKEPSAEANSTPDAGAEAADSAASPAPKKRGPRKAKKTEVTPEN